MIRVLPIDDPKTIHLFIDPQTRAVLDERRLNDEDIQRALHQAEKTGKKFVHPDNGRFLTGVRQGAVSIWVEYGSREDGFEICKAYQYRLAISAWDLRTGQSRSDPV